MTRHKSFCLEMTSYDAAGRPQGRVYREFENAGQLAAFYQQNRKIEKRRKNEAERNQTQGSRTT